MVFDFVIFSSSDTRTLIRQANWLVVFGKSIVRIRISRDLWVLPQHRRTQKTQLRDARELRVAVADYAGSCGLKPTIEIYSIPQKYHFISRG